jgi:S-adenosylmethionine:tRNA-ribosyltransferase-isomerase (queuine synthetase)
MRQHGPRQTPPPLLKSSKRPRPESLITIGPRLSCRVIKLYFTNALLKVLSAKGIDISKITLHVGYGTCAPIRTEQINATRKSGGRIGAVGTTTVQALELTADDYGRVKSTDG